ncbi:MAG: MarR family transcriptional regulator [Thermoplasmataceae archaeon]
MLEIELNDYEIPTSARLVLMVLKRLRIADFRTIEMESGLSKRSVLYAVKMLREMGLIDIQICLNDTRKRFYCIRIKEGNPSQMA